MACRKLPRERNVMRKLLILTAAIGSLSALLAFDAGAMPFAKHGIGSNDLTLARDNCGRGFRFSERRQRCVPDDDDRRGPPGCPPGFEFSERRGSCVQVER